MKTINSLNPMTLPLQGTCLIEASAGTGKTYTLTIIYLRLLLGLGGKAAFSRPLSVTEILVVTFTEKANKELRGRIRDSIHQLRLACMYGTSKDQILAELLSQLENYKLAALYLLAAEQQIDEAAIFTIHGFCQRMLSNSAIESNILFQQTILEDETLLCQQASADFWRRYCYPLPLEVARVVHQYWTGPENLLAELLPYLQRELPEVCNPPDLSESISTQYESIITRINELKQYWRLTAVNIPTILNAYKLDYRVYNKKNLSSWLAKINHWAEQPTSSDLVPDELKWFTSVILAEKTISGNPPHHELFVTIQAFHQQRTSLRDLIFMMALVEIRQALEHEKLRRAELGFDDLIVYLDRALTGYNGKILAKLVRSYYPVAMIDEFQDTDPKQYRIFSRIYISTPDCALILIGDPKQAIYAFRGADIFTYMRARSEIDTHYTLDTNWRSAPGMINAVNQLFQSVPAPFVFGAIQFLPVKAKKNNACLQLVVKQQSQPALQIWLQPGASVSTQEYLQYMAQQCAVTIRNWLNAAHKGEAWLEGNQEPRLMRASDITVLVRNRHEALLIRDALTILMIPSVYLSNWDSVFNTHEAQELLWILQAVLMPENNNILRTALATSLLGLNASTINTLNNNEQRWNQQVEEFVDYHLLWQKSGVFIMLRQIMIKYRIAENFLASHGGERQLINVLHLSELLQEASIQLENEHALVRWLALQIASPNPKAVHQQLRLESDRHLVQIITIHKSKGLEFPLVFLPFAANFRVQKQALFHNRETYKMWLDLCAAKKSLQLADEERLAEDLRLLYVALTRSIYHCSIGIAPLYHGNRKKSSVSDLHLSALGYLIQRGKHGNANDLRECLAALVNRASGDINLCEISSISKEPLISKITPMQLLSARNWSTLSQDCWLVTSYSELQKHQNSLIMKLQPPLDFDAIDTLSIETSISEKQKILQQLTPYTFPRGVKTGTFLHGLFETLDFNQSLDTQWLHKQMIHHGIDLIWLPVIIEWVKKIIAIPLDGNSLSLGCLTLDNKCTELQFYLSIDHLVQACDLDEICKRYDALSVRCPSLNFPKIKGILKGFIDLVFRWQDRYYLLDYKSNWLGRESTAYTQLAMERTMITHRYDLQYQIYTLALHRYLRQRLTNYHYLRDFGGVYYLFLRGIDAAHSGNGIFYCRPDYTLINRLDALFAGLT